VTAPLQEELFAWLNDKRTPRLEGWATMEKAIALMTTAWSIRPFVAVEIGVWAGRSLLPVALVMRETGMGTIHAIDPWNPNASAEGYDKVNADWWTNSANHDYAKKQFDEMISQAGLFHIVRTHQKRSDDVEPPEVIDLLHIDGQHTQQARRDVARFGSRVRVGGFCFMDDVDWVIDGVPSVRQATCDLESLGFVKLYAIITPGQTCEVFQRVK